MEEEKRGEKRKVAGCGDRDTNGETGTKKIRSWIVESWNKRTKKKKRKKKEGPFLKFIVFTVSREGETNARLLLDVCGPPNVSSPYF